MSPKMLQFIVMCPFLIACFAAVIYFMRKEERREAEQAKRKRLREKWIEEQGLKPCLLPDGWIVLNSTLFCPNETESKLIGSISLLDTPSFVTFPMMEPDVSVSESVRDIAA